MADLGDSWVPQLQLVAGSAALREYHSNLRPAPEDSPQSLTRDYFAEWIRPTYHVKRAGEDSEIRSSERTTFDPINLRISKGGQDREEGNSKKEEANLDLNLKLGFWVGLGLSRFQFWLGLMFGTSIMASTSN